MTKGRTLALGLMTTLAAATLFSGCSDDVGTVPVTEATSDVPAYTQSAAPIIKASASVQDETQTAEGDIEITGAVPAHSALSGADAVDAASSVQTLNSTGGTAALSENNAGDTAPSAVSNAPGTDASAVSTATTVSASSDTITSAANSIMNAVKAASEASGTDRTSAANTAGTAPDSDAAIITTSSGTTAASYPLLRRGDESEYVTTLQKSLMYLGYLDRHTGFFGSDTESALRAFQRANHLDADGIAGSKTWNALMSGNAVKAD